MLAFVRADPRGYLATLLPLGAHSVGLQGRNDPGIYWPLLAGAQVALVPRTVASDGASLLARIEEVGASVMQATP